MEITALPFELNISISKADVYSPEEATVILVPTGYFHVELSVSYEPTDFIETISYEWYVGRSEKTLTLIGKTPTISHTFEVITKGAYLVRCKVAGTYIQKTIDQWVLPLNAAAFSSYPVDKYPLTVLLFGENFTDEEVLEWKWNMGNDSTLQYSNMGVGYYNAVGDYRILVSIRTATGLRQYHGWLRIQEELSVNSIKKSYGAAYGLNPSLIFTNPTAKFTASALVVAPNTTVDFTDVSVGEIDEWSWNFGDTNGSVLQNPSYSWDTPGTYEVTLTTTNLASGWTGEIVVPVIVNSDTNPDNHPPVAVISNDTTGLESGATEVSFTSDISTIPTSYLWNFGDGQTSTEASPTVILQPGDYTATLTVTNSHGSTTSAIQVSIAGEVSGLARHGDLRYALDKAMHRVVIYNELGYIWGVIGGFGSGQGQFNSPTQFLVMEPVYSKIGG